MRLVWSAGADIQQASTPFSMYRTTLFAALISIAATAAAEELEPIAPIKAPFPMPQLQRPAIPSRTVSIRDHGAIEGGAQKNTGAFKKAIEACASQGGGRVVVPSGKW